jgi:hypothetical protein
MVLQVTPQGRKRWRLRYRYHGIPNMISLGLYPEVGLGAARQQRAEARGLLAPGFNPSVERGTAAAEVCTFEAVARDWLECLTRIVEKRRRSPDVLAVLSRNGASGKPGTIHSDDPILWITRGVRQGYRGDRVMKATLIVIQNDADHAEAKSLVEKLMRSSDSADQARMIAQARLIEAYERTRWPRRMPRKRADFSPSASIRASIGDPQLHTQRRAFSRTAG